MKLYQTSGEKQSGCDTGNPGDIEFHWSGTLAEARADRKGMKIKGLDFIKTDIIDVPTSKHELLEFLNYYSLLVEVEEKKEGAA